jgi:hypothetical protein
MMSCSRCFNDVEKHGEKLKSILCSDCVAREAAPPEIHAPIQRLSPDEKKAKKEARLAKRKAKLEAMKTKTRGKGKGWHLKRLFMFEGLYFSFGKEITAVEAAKIMKDAKKGLPEEPVARVKRKYVKRKGHKV